MISNSRPPYDKRTFHSEVINNYIKNLEPKFKDKILSKIFANCYPNTLDTTIDFNKEKKKVLL